MRAFVAGAASWDTVIHLAELPTSSGTVYAHTAYEDVGSTGAGKALNLAQLGHQVTLHTVLGRDRAADQVTSTLEGFGVRLLVDSDRVATEQHVNLMTPDGQRVSIYRTVTTPADPIDVDALVDVASASDVVVLNITDYVRHLVPAVVGRGLDFWTDLHDWDGHNPYHADFLSATHIVLSDERLGSQADLVCRNLAADGVLVVCTRGANGSTAWFGDERIDTPAQPVQNVIDTNGAGDAFTAGLIHGLHEGWPLRRALHAASVAGAAAVRSRALAAPELSPHLLDQ